MWEGHPTICLQYRGPGHNPGSFFDCDGARYNPVTDLIEYAEDGTGCHAALTYLLSGAPCYLVTGTEVGRGSDGEPVLQDVRLLADLKPCEDGFEITLY